ncbi:hypothetical protein D3C78_453590 [compost metagenome]
MPLKRVVKLKLSHADVLVQRRLDLADVLTELLTLQVVIEHRLVWNPAVALAQKTDKERREFTAAIDLFQTDCDGCAFFSFLLGDAPAQINFSEPHPSAFTRLTHFGKYPCQQVVSLGLHILEC